jgi:hypothetical protein
MEENQIELNIENITEERTYICPPHPVACVAKEEETKYLDEPVSAKETLPDLVRKAVEEVRNELVEVFEVELETRVQRVQANLQMELQLEIEKEKKELENDDQIKKL